MATWWIITASVAQLALLAGAAQYTVRTMRLLRPYSWLVAALLAEMSATVLPILLLLNEGGYLELPRNAILALTAVAIGLAPSALAFGLFVKSRALYGALARGVLDGRRLKRRRRP